MEPILFHGSGDGHSPFFVQYDLLIIYVELDNSQIGRLIIYVRDHIPAFNNYDVNCYHTLSTSSQPQFPQCPRSYIHRRTLPYTRPCPPLPFMVVIKNADIHCHPATYAVSSVFGTKQDKSEGFDSCDRPSNLTQIGFKSSIFQPCDLEI